MGNFDQRGQKVTNQTNIAGNQYNAGRDITHVEGDLVQGVKVAGDKNVYVAIVEELKPLLRQVEEAAQTGDLDGDTALDAEYSLKKAVLEADKEKPDKTTLLEHLDKGKTVLDKAVGISKSAAALAAALGAAYGKIAGWF